MSGNRIGIFGGTFDPVHFGHLRPALELCENLGLDCMRLLPAHRPALRDVPGATTAQRIAMLELATAGSDQLIVDTQESLRDKPSYSVDTLRLFRKEFPQSQLMFFMGMDAFDNLTQWHQYEQLFELAHLVVINRPGASLSGAEALIMKKRQRASVADCDDIAGGILIAETAQTDLSATRIRDLLARGRNIRYLVPESVRAYILDNKLYH